MTLNEKEQNLIEEIDFFSKNVLWWEAEIEKVTQKLMRFELTDNIALPEERDKLIAQFTYLTSKARVEKIAAGSIENKLRKLRLEKELVIIGEIDT